MLSEEFLSAASGPHLTSNTAISKDVGIYHHSLTPTSSVRATFKKSSAPPHCLAASDTHIFAAQKDKAYVHVYSRLRGNQEAFVPFSDRIRSIVLAGDVLILGTTEGRVLLWELCTRRLVSSPAVHVQAISCMAATQTHLITGSDDSSLSVWSLARLLDLDASSDPDPDRTLTNHRAAITSVVASRSSSPHASLCVSASKDKTCVVWNYATGEPLRTLLFPSAPLCLSIDALPRSLVVSTDNGSLYLLGLFDSNALIGTRSEDSASILIKAPAPMAQAGPDQGPALCIALSHDGNTLLTGHPKGQILKWFLNGHSTELANLNSAVTNLVFLSPLAPSRATRPSNVVHPTQVNTNSPYTTQFDKRIQGSDDSRFSTLLATPGFSNKILVDAAGALDKSMVDDEARTEEKELQNVLTALHELGATRIS